MALFPSMQIVLITADAAILKSRLETRGRESAPDIEARLARLREDGFRPAEVTEIRNDGLIAIAGGRLLGLLTGREAESRK